jgi:glycosyltransferase involved in cell wall biosynthesis
MAEPLVSVVTPFYNTASHLAECIESVLTQSYRNFEYLLVNNLSTDGSRDIAARYAAKDPRVRLTDNSRFVGQVENYNGALLQISPASCYVKIVQADDAIFPECIARMVEVAEREPRVGLVASYRRRGDHVAGTEVPPGVTAIKGREACRMMLLDGCFLLGSPTTVLYRADVVRSRNPFYALGRYHEDTEAGYEILLHTDLGFVHEILSFSRTDNESVMASRRGYNPAVLDYLIVLERYGPSVLTPNELARQRAFCYSGYYRFLGRALWRLRGRRFWQYHHGGLTTIGQQLHWPRVIREAILEPLRLARSPRQTFRRTIADLRQRVLGPRSSRRLRSIKDR